MAQAGPLVTAVLQAMVALLFLAGVARFLVMVAGWRVLRRYMRAESVDDSETLVRSPLVPSVSVIFVPPDVSEESREFARRLLDLNFAWHEVVLVLEGPSETALATWSREFHLCLSARPIEDKLRTAHIRGIYESRDPLRIVIVDKERGGTADALNAGVNAASSPVIGLIDPESEFSASVLLWLIRPMLEAPERALAVCGAATVAPSEAVIGLFGALESLRTWLGGAAMAGRNSALPLSGSSVLAWREAIVQAGGFSGGALELVLRLHGFARAAGKPYSVVFVPERGSHVRAPHSLADLRRLVLRDQREIARACRKGRLITGALGPRGVAGLYCMRFLCPLVETAAYVLAAVGLSMGWVDVPLAILLLLSTAATGMVLSMAAVMLRELAAYHGSDPGRLAAMFFAAIPENLGYRQLRNLWLIAGFWKYWWRRPERTAFPPEAMPQKSGSS